MDNQPQNPEFRNNPENFHHKIIIGTLMHRARQDTFLSITIVIIFFILILQVFWVLKINILRLFSGN